jgi:hypothetical protein
MSTKLNFLKRMHRYGSWSYPLIDDDYIACRRNKHYYVMYVMKNGIHETKFAVNAEALWDAVECEIIKYSKNYLGYEVKS